MTKDLSTVKLAATAYSQALLDSIVQPAVVVDGRSQVIAANNLAIQRFDLSSLPCSTQYFQAQGCPLQPSMRFAMHSSWQRHPVPGESAVIYLWHANEEKPHVSQIDEIPSPSKKSTKNTATRSTQKNDNPIPINPRDAKNESTLGQDSKLEDAWIQQAFQSLAHDSPYLVMVADDCSRIVYCNQQPSGDNSLQPQTLASLFEALQWKPGRSKRLETFIRDFIRSHRQTEHQKEWFQHPEKHESSHATLSITRLSPLKEKRQVAMVIINDQAGRVDYINKTMTYRLAQQQEIMLNIRHDLRTPLSSILALSKLANQHNQQELLRPFLKNISHAITQAIQMTDAMVEPSQEQFNPNAVHLYPVDVASELEHMTQLFTPMAQKKNLEIHFTSDGRISPYLCTDRVRFYRILTNLIGNAIKYTDNGSVHIHVRNLMSTSDREHLQITIEDTGIGIPEDELGNIFDRFIRVKTEKIYEGTGLGLAIVKDLVNELRGNIQVMSQYGKGTVFTLTLPFPKSDLMAQTTPEDLLSTSEPSSETVESTFAPTDTDTKTEPASIRLLVVEDNEIASFVVRSLINSIPDLFTKVAYASNGREAFEELEEHDYDLILLDINLPDTDGIRLADNIRHTSTVVPVIVALTAHSDTSKAELIQNGTFDDVLQKPLSEDKLHRIIQLYRRKLKS